MAGSGAGISLRGVSALQAKHEMLAAARARILDDAGARAERGSGDVLRLDLVRAETAPGEGLMSIVFFHTSQ